MTAGDAGGGLLGTEQTLARDYDLGLLDLDGVVYVGQDPVPGAADAIASASKAGMRLCYVTNNASRPPSTVAEHLRRLGITADEQDVVTSAQAAAAVLAGRLPAGAPVLVVGGEGLYVALEDEGLRGVGSMRDGPLAVVQGFSPDVGWRLLAEGSRAVRAGLPWMATNTDLTVPTPYGPAPGNGTLVAAVATATGATPEVAGKPRPPLFEQAVRRYGSRRPLVVGDRLDTDIEGAHAAGIPALLVLTGVCGAVEAAQAPQQHRPRFIGRDLADLEQPHPVPARLDSGWTCRGSSVALDGGALRVVAAGDDALDLLRAACCASWQALDAGSPPPDLAGVLAALRRWPDAAAWAR